MKEEWIVLNSLDMPRNIMNSEMYEYQIKIGANDWTDSKYNNEDGYYHPVILSIINKYPLRFRGKHVVKESWNKSKTSMGDKYENPACCRVQLSNVSGQVNLFGSNIQQNNFVSIKISKGFMVRDLSTDWFMNNEQYIEVYLSPVQWAELLTTGFSSSGTPATLHRKDGVTYELPVNPPKRELYTEENKSRMMSILNTIEQAQQNVIDNLETGKPLSKKAQAELFRNISGIKERLERSLEFTLESFEETMDKVVVEAKASIESHIGAKIQSLGIESLKNLQISILED